jgi:A/G-specific adenine glycosylase
VRAKRSPLARYSDEGRGAEIAGALLDWFARFQRDLPWRRSRDPYRIWVSEVMLQQTRVETVIPYYERWFAQFPTLMDLAGAPIDQVLKAWEGLGYYSRARNLHRAVQAVAAQYGGEVPDDEAAVRSLPGVGPYTAGAILSIAFNRAVPAVDGNVMRVLSRLFRIGDDIMKPATRESMDLLARGLIPEGQASAINQALMELGALICTPTSPKCLACPVAGFCTALQHGEATAYPVKSKAKPPREIDLVAVLVEHDGRLLIQRRPEEGLLGGLWVFPMVELQKGESHLQAVHRGMRELYGLPVAVDAQLAAVRHVFSHLIWNLKAYLVSPDLALGGPRKGAEELHEGPAAAHPPVAEPPPLNLAPDHRWVTAAELAQYAFPVAHQHVIAALQTHLGG